MVQVDVFWSYGLGATFAVGASRQLLARRRAAAAAAPLPDAGTSPFSRWSDPYLMRALLFLALIFVPSGVWLVWAFPSWETMHAGDRDMPVALVTAFALTNVTQGLLGYLVTERLLARGRTYLAYLQVLAGYAGMFFILVHGWDGTGYRRFFSATREDFLAWEGDWTAWLTSDVALSLYGMALVLVPVLLGTVVHWHVTGRRLEPGRVPGRARPLCRALARDDLRRRARNRRRGTPRDRVARRRRGRAGRGGARRRRAAEGRAGAPPVPRVRPAGRRWAGARGGSPTGPVGGARGAATAAAGCSTPRWGRSRPCRSTRSRSTPWRPRPASPRGSSSTTSAPSAASTWRPCAGRGRSARPVGRRPRARPRRAPDLGDRRLPALRRGARGGLPRADGGRHRHRSGGARDPRRRARARDRAHRRGLRDRRTGSGPAHRAARAG